MTTCLQSLNAALRWLLENESRVYLWGEDLLDPYGGAFKVTAGLQADYPDRVRTTPISEAALVGMGNGMALRGFHPSVEIMFGDFITLAADQIVNYAAKFRAMYAGQAANPLVIRAPMGGGRGYGPTHSQTLEKIFFGIPGLRIVAPSLYHDPGELLKTAVLESQDPVLFVEHKLLYAREILPAGETMPGRDGFPTRVLRNYASGEPDATLIAYGGAREQGAGRLVSDESRLSKGPAYGMDIAAPKLTTEDWPIYRHDGLRSVTTPVGLNEKPSPVWESELGEPVPAPTP